MTLEKLAEKIMIECEKEGEPVTKQEALEMAEMEIKANGIKRYEKSDKPRKKSIRERKIDETKKRILSAIKVLIDGMGADITNVKTETEITFNFNDEEYSIKIIKHRKKKGE